MIAIEKNIPLPANIRRNGRPSKYPIAAMDINDSFIVTTENPKKIEVLRANVFSAIKYTKDKSKRFITRKVSDNAIRVWRIA